MLVPITAIYAAPLAVIGMTLAARAGGLRGKLGIPTGDGGNADLLQRARAHANFAEYVPLILVLMALYELNGGASAWLHGLGVALLAARIVHPFGMASIKHPARFFGAAVTALALLAAAGLLAWQTWGANVHQA
jgi:uncharacterized membrane protein YecN with MAPEG domain